MLSRRATDAGETVPVTADDRSSYTVRFSVSTDGAGIVRRSLGGTNVCNGYGGDYALVDGTLLLNGVDEDAAFCEDAGSPVASAFSRVMFDTASPPMVAFEGDDLVLRSGANESLGFTDGLVAGETALNRVFDVRWRLSSFTTGTGEPVVQAVPEPATVFELVSGTGIVNGTPGCIDRFGYAVEGATLTFVEIPGTGPGCDGALGGGCRGVRAPDRVRPARVSRGPGHRVRRRAPGAPGRHRRDAGVLPRAHRSGVVAEPVDASGGGAHDGGAGTVVEPVQAGQHRLDAVVVARHRASRRESCCPTSSAAARSARAGWCTSGRTESADQPASNIPKPDSLTAT